MSRQEETPRHQPGEREADPPVGALIAKRDKANKNLPQNLYFDSRRSSYRYRRQVVSVRHRPHQGHRRGEAVEPRVHARGRSNRRHVWQLNRVLRSFLDAYERDVLLPRELAKGALVLISRPLPALPETLRRPGRGPDHHPHDCGDAGPPHATHD